MSEAMVCRDGQWHDPLELLAADRRARRLAALAPCTSEILDIRGNLLFTGAGGVRAVAVTAAVWGAELKAADLRGLDLSGLDLTGIRLPGAFLRSANFSGSRLHNADLRGADLRWTDFSGSDLSGAQFAGAGCYQTKFRWAVLSEARLECSLTRCDMQEARLAHAWIPEHVRHLYAIELRKGNHNPYTCVNAASLALTG